MFKGRLSRTVFSVGLIVTGVLAVVQAQTPRPIQTTSTSLEDLLTEVRGLRVEINQAAGASIRMQVITRGGVICSVGYRTSSLDRV